MRVGQGQLGYSSGIKPFVHLQGAAGARPVLVIVKPAVLVEGWSNFSGPAFQAEFNQDWGHRRDIVAMRTSTEVLTRVGSESRCVSTEGSYFYDPEYASNLPAFVWDSTPLDSGYYWDQVPFVYVHLTDGADPNSTVVVAQLGFYYSNEASEHPTLGPDRLEGAGSFEGSVQ